MKKPLLFALLGVVALGVVTVPWQRQQWTRLQEAREQTKRQQERLQALQGEQKALATPPLDTSDVITLFDAAQQRVARRDTAGALPYIQALEARAGDSADQQREVAGLYQQIGYVDKAYFLARAALQKDPQSVPNLLRLGYLEGILGYLSDSNAHLAEAIRLSPESAEPHVSQALIWDQQALPVNVEKELREALARTTETWSIRLLLADSLIKQKRYDAAEKELRDLEREKPGEIAPSLMRLQRFLHQTTDAPPTAPLLAQAVESARAILELAPDNVEALGALARLYLRQEKFTDAVPLLEKVVQLLPKNTDYKRELGRAWVRLGKRAEGSALLKEVGAQDKEEEEYTRLVVQLGQSNGDPTLRRTFARWCVTHKRHRRARLEWQLLLEKLPADKEAKGQITQLNRD